MKRLTWIALIMAVVLVVLMGTAVAYGRTLAASASTGMQSAGFGVCGGSLCLFQVVPGTTTWYAAKQDLAQYITRDEGDHFHGQVGEMEIRVEMNENGEQIGRIDVQGSRMNQSPLAIRFNQIIDQFGSPCYVTSVRPDEGGVEVAYPSFRLLVLPNEGYITLESQIGAITLADDNNLSVDNRTCGPMQIGIPWRGFASVRLYQELQQASGLPGYYSYPSSGRSPSYGSTNNYPGYGSPSVP
jgi:hypothetical protein